MAYRDLREFIAKLEKEGELKRIAVEADPALEITEITDRVTRSGGPALLFEKPRGSRVPLLINMLGSESRMNLALEVSSMEEVAARIRGFLDTQSPQGLLDKIKMLPKLAGLGSLKNLRRSAPRACTLPLALSARSSTYLPFSSASFSLCLFYRGCR